MSDDALVDIADRLWDEAINEGIILEDTYAYLRSVLDSLRGE